MSCNNATDPCERANARIATLEAEVARLREQLATSRATEAATEQQLEIKSALLESERAAHEQTRRNHEGATARLREELEKSRLALIQYETNKRATEAAHEQTRAELAEHEEAAIGLHEELKAADARAAELEAKLEDAERGERDAVKACDDNWVTHQRVVAAESALASARTLLGDLHAELEDRGGALSRKTWNRLETYVEEVAAHPTPGAEKGAGK